MSLLRPPCGLAEIRSVYGDFRQFLHPDGSVLMRWESLTLTSIQLPTPLPLDWMPDVKVERIRCHRLLAPSLSEIFSSLHSRQLFGKRGLKTFAGCYEFRRQRGAKRPSLHCWGAAIDFNAAEDPLGDEQIDMDPDVVEVFEERGWTWGGRFSRVDANHFQFAREY